MNGNDNLLLDHHVREGLWSHVVKTIEDYVNKVDSVQVSPELDPGRIRALLEPYDFRKPVNPIEAVDFVVEGLIQYQVHTPHPRYFGLFNPAPTTMGIVADMLVAAFNPQLAAWSHNPFANEIERLVVQMIGSRFGYNPTHLDGTFTSGGAEANHTALLTALEQAFPRFATDGLRSLDAQPVLYVSTESHHSLIKAARFCGLGTSGVRVIPVDENFRMDIDKLLAHIKADRSAGFTPFMVVATAGTTNAGVIDPLVAIGAIAADEQLWFHADAAWGGAAVLVPELRPLFDGIEQADSITFDAHKWLSVPMAAGMYFTRHNDVLNRVCRVTTDYMPHDADQLAITDPYNHSMQWSRRFIGLKVFLSLAVAGWDGYEAAIRHQVAMGALLRRELEASNWKVINQTDLAVVCFQDGESPKDAIVTYLDTIAREVVSSGRVWISTTRLGENTNVLRACITNYRTDMDDVYALVDMLNDVRNKVNL